MNILRIFVKLISLVISIVIPGLGTIMVGKIKLGVIQLVLFGIALFFLYTAVGVIISLPLYLVILVWAWWCIIFAKRFIPNQETTDHTA